MYGQIVGSCYCTFPDKNNLYMFVTSKNFLVPITTTLSAQTYSSTFCVSKLTIFVIL